MDGFLPNSITFFLVVRSGEEVERIARGDTQPGASEQCGAAGTGGGGRRRRRGRRGEGGGDGVCTLQTVLVPTTTSVGNALQTDVQMIVAFLFKYKIYQFDNLVFISFTCN